MENYTQFFTLLDSLIGLFDEMIALENKKLDAIAANDIAKIEQYMKDEQAYALKMRGLDGKRDAIQTGLGFEGMTLREIVSKLSKPQSELLAKKDACLRAKIGELKEAIACARKYIELHIHSIQTLLDAADGTTNGTGTYDGAGNHDSEPPKRFETKKI